MQDNHFIKGVFLEMFAILSVLLAVVCYAMQNVVVVRKLATVHPVLVSGIVAIVVVLCNCLVYALRDRLGLAIVSPTSKEVAIAAGVGVILFVAEVSYLNAYYCGGSLAMVTTVVMLIPVFASVIQFTLGGGLPHIYEYLGYMCAALAVWLVSLVPPSSPH